MTSVETKYPRATVAPYGPNDRQATKLVVAIFPRQQKEPATVRKWSIGSGDIRQDESINNDVVSFLKEHNVAHATVADRILGCPHEEGIDYPAGGPCPYCPFWAGRKRLMPPAERRTGRNDLCLCGSGKKFKKCCGAS
jgi:uncharacterized protein YecA (UPF0149 family)